MSGIRESRRKTGGGKLKIRKSKRTGDEAEDEELRLAILTGNLEVAQDLVPKLGRTYLNAVDQNNRSSILQSAFVNQLDICLLLLDNKVVIDLVDNTQSSILHLLCKADPSKQDDLTLKTLLHGIIGRGLDINARDAAMNTPLHYAAAARNHAAIQVLITHKCNVDTGNDRGATPLLLTLQNYANSQSDHQEEEEEEETRSCALSLLDAKADPRVRDQQGQTALDVARLAGDALADLVVRMDGRSKESAARSKNRRSNSKTGQSISKRGGAGGAGGGASTSSTNSPRSTPKTRKVVAVGELALRQAAHQEKVIAPIDANFIKALDVQSKVCVNYGLATTKAELLDRIAIHGLYKEYQTTFYNRSHQIFVYRNASSPKVFVVGNKSGAQESWPILVLNKYGMWRATMPAHIDVLPYLMREWGGTRGELALLANNQATSSEINKMIKAGVGVKKGESAPVSPRKKLSLTHDTRKKSDDEGPVEWCEINPSQSDLPLHLLALECRLGLNKQLTVGMYIARARQTEEEAFGNRPNSRSLKTLLRILCDQVDDLKGWQSYSGSQSEGPLFYTSWRGFEIVFHVAPYMSQGEQRQHIGNDKVLLLLQEEGAANPEFRGNVNSVTLVVQPVSSSGAAKMERERPSLESPAPRGGGWRMGCYYRKRVNQFQPILTNGIIRGDSLLRDLLLCNAINAHQGVVHSPPYSKNTDRLYVEGCEKIVETFFEEKEPLSRKSLSQSVKGVGLKKLRKNKEK